MNGHGGKRPGAGRPKGAVSRANEQVRQEEAATGELPLAYMLRVLRDPSQPVGRRDDMAKAAAPFCHSRPERKCFFANFGVSATSCDFYLVSRTIFHTLLRCSYPRTGMRKPR